MKKVFEKYQEAVKLENDAAEVVNSLCERDRKGKESIKVNKLTIVPGESTLSQFLFAVGILTSQIAAAKLLGEKEEAITLKEKLELIVTCKFQKEEYDEWYEYHNELYDAKKQLFNLLSNEEKASLIELPAKPKK